MAAIPAVVGAALIGGLATVGATLLTKPKAPKAEAIQPVRQPTRIEALARAERSDILSRRRGTDANRRVGFGGGEAFTGPRRSLLGR